MSDKCIFYKTHLLNHKSHRQKLNSGIPKLFYTDSTEKEIAVLLFNIKMR